MANRSTFYTFVFEPSLTLRTAAVSTFASVASSDDIRVEDSSSARTVRVSITSSICLSNARSMSSMYSAQYKEKGCRFATELGLRLEAHLQKCDYAELICTQGCKRKIFRKDMAEHLRCDCPKRITLCPYCHVHGCFDNITTQHRQVCQEYLVGCPRKCGESSKQIKRKGLRGHKNVCPLELIMCNSCNETVIRQNIKAHKSNFNHFCASPHCNMNGPYDTINGPHLIVCQEYPCSWMPQGV